MASQDARRRATHKRPSKEQLEERVSIAPDKDPPEAAIKAVMEVDPDAPEADSDPAPKKPTDKK